MLKTSQPRIAKIERAASDVSLDQIVRALTAAGGRIEVRVAKGKARALRKKAAHTRLTIHVATAAR